VLGIQKEIVAWEIDRQWNWEFKNTVVIKQQAAFKKTTRIQNPQYQTQAAKSNQKGEEGKGQQRNSSRGKNVWISKW